VLNNGIVIAIKKGKSPGKRRMMTAHMDEVGYRINRIDDNGFGYFDGIGSPNFACLPGRKMLVRGKKGTIIGISGVRSAHLLTEEQKKMPQTISSHILIFAFIR
jgi:endoglucanase